MKALKDFVERMKEPSTWRGLIALATLAGYSISPEQGELIISTGVGLYSIINIFRKEKK